MFICHSFAHSEHFSLVQALLGNMQEKSPLRMLRWWKCKFSNSSPCSFRVPFSLAMLRWERAEEGEAAFPYSSITKEGGRDVGLHTTNICQEGVIRYGRLKRESKTLTLPADLLRLGLLCCVILIIQFASDYLLFTSIYHSFCTRKSTCNGSQRMESL